MAKLSVLRHPVLTNTQSLLRLLSDLGGSCSRRSVDDSALRLAILIVGLFVPELFGQAYFYTDESSVRFGNNLVEIRVRASNGHVSNIIDKRTGHDFITASNPYWNGFSLVYSRAGKVSTDQIGGYLARNFVATSEQLNDGMRVNLKWDKFQINGTSINFAVVVAVTIRNDSALTSWQISIANREDISIESVAFPSITGIGQIGQDANLDYLAYPSLSGMLFKDPVHNFRVGRGWGWELYYPSGSSNMQFIGYYSSQTKTGLYLSPQDTAGHMKFINTARPNSEWLSFSVHHIPEFAEGADVSMPYAVVLGVFQGDWYDAAKIYRSWATRQSWTQQGSLSSRQDVPNWYKRLGLMGQIYTRYWTKDDATPLNGSYSSLPEIADAWKQRFDSPPALVWTGWEKSGQWRDAIDFLPPSEGWTSFDQAVRATHSKGGKLMIQPTTNQAAIGTPGWDSVKSNASTARDGSYYSFTFSPIDLSGRATPQTFATMDPTGPWRNAVSSNVTVLMQHGIDIVQMDGGPAMPHLCFNPAHPHPKGGGNWWYRGYSQLFADSRDFGRQLNPGALLGAEYHAEVYIPFLGGAQDSTNTGLDPSRIASDSVIDPSKVAYIPLWQSVYHDYILTYSQKVFVDGHDQPFYRRGLAQALTWGETPMVWVDKNGWYYPDPQLMAYLGRIIDARTTYAYSFLVEGEMLRSPSLDVPVTRIPAATRIPYTLASTNAFDTPAVYGSAWRSPQGSVALLFTNHSGLPVSLSTRLDEDLSLDGASLYDAYLLRNGACTAQRNRTRIPLALELTTNPLDVVMLVVTPASDQVQYAGCGTSLPFWISNGAVSINASNTSPSTTVGYGVMIPDRASTTPAGLAILGFRQDGVLVSETSVPASPLIQNGRIYAEVNGPLNTGVAIANPNNQDAIVSFRITDAAGVDVHSGRFTVHAHKQNALFLNEAPISGPSALLGTFSFSSDVPISVVALRTFFNERVRPDFLMTTLPVVNTDAAAPRGTQIIPHFAEGAGFTTHILLVNPTSTPLRGALQFFSQGSGSATAGAPVSVSVNGQVLSSVSYSIPARGSAKISTSGKALNLTSGSVRIIPTDEGAAPVPLVVFGYKPEGVTLSEAGVPATQGTAFKMYVESAGALNSASTVQSGFAIANTSNVAGTVTLELTRLDGTTNGLLATVTRTLPASGQIAGFLGDFFTNVPALFKGVLRISTTTSGISVVGIRSRHNEVGSFLMTTTPPINEAAPPLSSQLLFPHIVNGGDYTTEFILFSGASGQASTGNIRFFRNDGTSLSLTFN